jgi:hypothetical protein
MTLGQIERVAEDVLTGYDCGAPPIDVFGIAREEGIELGPGNYGDDFSGRIEYHRDVGKFFLFHPDPETARHPARVRFSVGHELGHYFLDHHRELLIQGAAHNSTSDFICEDNLEHEADEFAAALLVPGFVMKRRLAKRSFMTLSEVLRMADDCRSSATSTAIRYAKFTREACVVVISEGGRVVFWVPSEEAGAIGLRFLSRNRVVPSGAPTAMASGEEGGVREGVIGSVHWFPDRSRELDLWEEACALGSTGRVLTLLALNNTC